MNKGVIKPVKAAFKINILLFCGFGSGILSLYVSSFWNRDFLTVLLFGFLLVVTITLSCKGILALWGDYKLRHQWHEAQKPTNKTHDARYATYQEMYDAGMFDGKGRLLGITKEGYLIFEPHKRKPVFTYFHGPQGAYKSVAGSFISSLLHAVVSRRTDGDE